MEIIRFIFMWLMSAFVNQALGNRTRQNLAVKQSQVEMGSKITLIGISSEDEGVTKTAIAWYKDGRTILLENTFKYTFLASGTVLVINEFMTADVGHYVFICSLNGTAKHRVFYLALLPPSSLPWYKKNPSTVGTAIGMMFLILLLLAIVYYCCNKDADATLPSSHKKQGSPPQHIQNNNDFNYNGVRFSSMIQVAKNPGRAKSPREVRQDSIIALSAISKQSIDKLKKKKTTRKGSIGWSTSLPAQTYV